MVRFAGVDGWPAEPYATDWNNFGPRFGFAWKVAGSEKTVVRGGFGIAYAHPFDHGVPNANSLGFEKSAGLTTPDNGVTAPFLLRNGVPGISLGGDALTPGFGAVGPGKNPTTNVNFFETNRATGYSQQFNLGIQRELSRNIVLEIGYLGQSVAQAGHSRHEHQSDSRRTSSTRFAPPASSARDSARIRSSTTCRFKTRLSA